MNLYNEIAGGRWNRLLQKKFNIRGDGAPQLSPDIQASVTIQEDRDENRYLAEEILCRGLVQQTAVAAQNSAIQIANPNGSNRLLVVETAFVFASAATNYQGGIVYPNLAGDLATASTDVGVIDPRVLGGSSTANQLRVAAHLTSTTAVGGVVTPNLIFGNTASTGQLYATRRAIAILPPRAALKIVASTVNIALTVAFEWYEFALETTET